MKPRFQNSAEKQSSQNSQSARSQTPKKPSTRDDCEENSAREPTMANPPHPQMIEARAYFIWESEGRPLGVSEEHWLRAERELRSE